MEGGAAGTGGVAAFGQADGGDREGSEGGLRQSAGEVVDEPGGAGEAAADDDDLRVEGEAEGHEELGRKVKPDGPGLGEGRVRGAVGYDGFGRVLCAGQVAGDAGQAGGGEVGLDAALATATIANTQMIGNGGGVLATGNVASSTTVTIVDSLISGGFRGVSMGGEQNVAGFHGRATIARSTIEGTDIGLLIQSTDPGSSSEADVGGSVIVNNLQAWGISETGARILSLGNNQVSGNADPSQGTLTSLLPM